MLFAIELYMLLVKNVTSPFFSHNYANIKIDSYHSLTLEKTLTLCNFVILIKSVFNKDKNHYYYNIFLEKCSYKQYKYERIDISERIDVNKTSASKECDICRYWYFLDEEFKFQTYVCNSCHGLLMMSINLDDRCIISGINKSEA